MAGVASPRRLFLLRLLSVAVFLGAWEITARLHIVSDFLLPPLSTVLERLWQDLLSGDLVTGLGLTLLRTMIGFAIAAVAGVVVGVLIARIKAMHWFFDPLVSIGLPLPKIAFLPIFILWFGVFDESKILMVAFNAVFPVIVAAWAGTESVEKLMVWSALSLGASRRQLLWEVALPAALPTVFTGLQVALPIALIVAIVSEMAMGGEGLGGAMMTSMRFADSPGVFAGIVAIAVGGSVLVKLMEIIRRRLLIWHQESQAR